VDGAFDNIKFNSLSGRLTLDNSSSRSNIDAGSTSGSVDLKGAFDRIGINTLSGSVSINSAIVPSTLKIETTSGSITIAVPSTDSVTVNHSTMSGRFSSDIPVILQGRGAQFEISSLSGSIRIREID
jgi:DUF4097 and DUF4098 domain-containing protein YvlB